MARMERITEPGYYHIINRGVEKRKIFLKKEDYNYFLRLLEKLIEEYDIIIHSFCLMTNHYHLILQVTKTNLSEAIKYLNVTYSKYFNKKYNRVGHLWQGRFQSYYLYDDYHCFNVAKYCERNPIKAKMVNKIDEYRYQSFYQWKNKSKYFNLLNNSIIFDMTLNEYEEFISSQTPTEILETIYKTPKVIKQNGKTKILYKRLETFFEEDKDINRDKNIARAYKYGYSKTKIANFLNLSVKTVSKKCLAPLGE